jgi:Zn finger protein HypA/HybF involved in hydrogenase expression
MHELSLAEGIMRQVNIYKGKHGFSRVKQIEIICGKFNAVSSENLEYLLSAQDDPCLHAVRIRLIRLSEQYYCTNCDFEFNSDSSDCAVCTRCQSGKFSIAAHNALFLNKMEVD